VVIRRREWWDADGARGTMRRRMTM